MFRRLGSNVPYLMLLLILPPATGCSSGLQVRSWTPGLHESIPIPSDMVAFDFPIDQVHTGCPGFPSTRVILSIHRKESDKNSSTVFYSADGMWTVYIPRETRVSDRHLASQHSCGAIFLEKSERNCRSKRKLQAIRKNFDFLVLAAHRDVPPFA